MEMERELSPYEEDPAHYPNVEPEDPPQISLSPFPNLLTLSDVQEAHSTDSLPSHKEVLSTEPAPIYWETPSHQLLH
jgi:hypothetical protein